MSLPKALVSSFRHACGVVSLRVAVSNGRKMAAAAPEYNISVAQQQLLDAWWANAMCMGKLVHGRAVSFGTCLGGEEHWPEWVDSTFVASQAGVSNGAAAAWLKKTLVLKPKTKMAKRRVSDQVYSVPFRAYNIGKFRTRVVDRP